MRGWHVVSNSRSKKTLKLLGCKCEEYLCIHYICLKLLLSTKTRRYKVILTVMSDYTSFCHPAPTWQYYKAAPEAPHCSSHSSKASLKPKEAWFGYSTQDPISQSSQIAPFCCHLISVHRLNYYPSCSLYLCWCNSPRNSDPLNLQISKWHTFYKTIFHATLGHVIFTAAPQGLKNIWCDLAQQVK